MTFMEYVHDIHGFIHDIHGLQLIKLQIKRIVCGEKSNLL
jgi:hypothetical protein